MNKYFIKLKKKIKNKIKKIVKKLNNYNKKFKVLLIYYRQRDLDLRL